MRHKKKKNATPSIFIGNGFFDGQFAYLLPFVDGYCMEKGIKRIIIESTLSMRIRSAPGIADILQKYELIENSGDICNKVFVKTRRIIESLKGLAFTTKVLRAIYQDDIFQKKDWYWYQILHGVWDSARNQSKDGKVLPSLFQLIKSSLRNFVSLKRTQRLLGQNSIHTVFLGHSVYAGRTVLAEFRNHDLNVYAQATEIIYKLPKDFDINPAALSQTEWAKMQSLLYPGEVEEAWVRRLNGESRNYETDFASRLQKNPKAKFQHNVIALHVFRDSPYNELDRTRIFLDYVEWITKTLEFVAESQEEWFIRSHPMAVHYGENQAKWIEAISKRVFGSKSLPKNIVFPNEQFSNTEMFRSVRRLVTFNGTSHIEAVAWGRKPIIISSCALSSLIPESLIKPLDIQEYKNYLLMDSDHPLFSAQKEHQSTAQQFLIARDMFMRFASDVGWRNHYRTQSVPERDRLLDDMLENFSRYESKMRSQGRLVALGHRHSSSSEFVTRQLLLK
jgi:hypothetical protein